VEEDEMAEPVIDRWLRRQGWLDGLAEAIQGVVGGVYSILGRPGRALKNLLHGTAVFHHPLHPAVTDVPIGAWMVGVVADVAAHYSSRVPTEAGDLALAVGLAVALVAALSGYTDFHETYGHERRVAVTHGVVMTVVVVLEAVSLALRWWAAPASHPLAVGLAIAAFALLLTGAYLGGHLVYAIGTMVNRNAFAEGPEDFVAIGRSDDFHEGTLTRVMADALPVVVVRRAGALHVMGAVCSHAGGPLDEGELDGDVVVCPWHGSRFCLRNGRAVGGPASFGQPVMDIREVDGVVSVRPQVPLH
jgi:nitrite reductase/ring-hydroxylating ferredoxin subunit/uncharacterized membrane protein